MHEFKAVRRKPGQRELRGFTLIELMVVVAIVAILTAIALPSYTESVRKGRRGQAKADLVELAQIMERDRIVNNYYVEPTPNPIPESPREGDPVYDLDIDVEDGGAAFTITATPRAGTAQADDRCGILTLNHAGTRWHSDGDDAQCQFGTVGP